MWNGIKNFFGNILGGAQSYGQYIAGYGTRNVAGGGPNLYNQLNGQSPTTSHITVPHSFIPTANAQTAGAPGNPQAAANQQAADVQKYFPGGFGGNQSDPVTNYVGGLTSQYGSPNLSNQNYSINPGDNISSASTNSNTTLQDAQNARNNAAAGLANGTAPYNYTPSDQMLAGMGNSGLSSIAGDIYNTSLYSPQQQDLISQGADINTRIMQTQLAARRQIQGLLSNGSITREQAQGFTSEAQRLSDAQLADLATQQTGNTLSQQVLAQLQQNKLGALTNLAGYMKPTEVSPGSTLVNPLTGQPTYTGMGASPQTVMSTAMQLWTQAQQSGTATYNTDGTPDLQPYLQQAQQYYGGGGVGTYGGQSSGAPQRSNTQGGYPGTGQSGYGQNGYGNTNMIPQNLQYAVRTDTIGSQGIQYINAGQVNPSLLPQAYQAGGNAGIPVLDANGVGALNAAQQILGIVDAAKALSIRNLSSGTSGRITNAMKAWANNYLQFNPDLSNFDQLRDAASKATTALAGGNGSGFRMNMGIIEAAVGNLPRASDNLETALTRADALATQIINGLKPMFPQVSYGNYGNLLQSQYGGNGSASQSSGSGIYHW